MMEIYRFLELVEKEKGFEFYQAFRDEVDWVIGGKDDTYWFTVLNDQSVKDDMHPQMLAQALCCLHILCTKIPDATVQLPQIVDPLFLLPQLIHLLR